MPARGRQEPPPRGGPHPPAVCRPRILSTLACPLCGGALAADPAAGALRCAERHSFDIARQGYVNLATGSGSPLRADEATMVRARERFLGAGHYAHLIGAVVAAIADLRPPPGMVLDAGAGTGHYLAAVLDALPAADGLALDLSRPAIRSAARAHPRAAALVWDVRRRLPLGDGSVDVVLDVFAPRNGAEFSRVLAVDGALVVVTPAPGHLGELVGPMGMLSVDPAKEPRTERSLAPYFTLRARTACTAGLVLEPADVEDLVRMGPSAWHRDAGSVRERARDLGPAVAVTAACTVSVYRPIP